MYTHTNFRDKQNKPLGLIYFFLKENSIVKRNDLSIDAVIDNNINYNSELKINKTFSTKKN
jgi:hypothetical protein